LQNVVIEIANGNGVHDSHRLSKLLPTRILF
jgi:hypothetical protein